MRLQYYNLVIHLLDIINKLKTRYLICSITILTLHHKSHRVRRAECNGSGVVGFLAEVDFREFLDVQGLNVPGKDTRLDQNPVLCDSIYGIGSFFGIHKKSSDDHIKSDQNKGYSPKFEEKRCAEQIH